MSSHDHLIYLYDPLCGWCYGSLPAVHRLADTNKHIVEPLPSGLFTGDPHRRMDADLAEHVRSVDSRIAAMTGQRFTDVYRRKVLGDRHMPFDSQPATEALTAVSLWNVRKELDALHALQRERFVAGRNLADAGVIARALAASLGGSDAEWRARLANPKLAQATQARIARARHIMRSVGVNGVPTLVWPSRTGLRLLPGRWLFGSEPLHRLLETLH